MSTIPSLGIHFTSTMPLVFQPLLGLFFQLNKLSTFDQSKAVIKQCQGGDFTVHVTVTNGSSSRGGAGSHPESIVARGFAYRNAVRQMILNDEGEKQT
ncbi:MAG: hypothetical protein QGG39_15565 [Candidatus Poribacteria bacterium]|nr:hypothetical protein [Candidatus Poribacteria bacterium]